MNGKRGNRKGDGDPELLRPRASATNDHCTINLNALSCDGHKANGNALPRHAVHA